MFPDAIAAKYRVVRTQNGLGESEAEYTIPLGSWRKGGGLEGAKGHVYECSPGWAGVWIKGRKPEKRIAELAVQFSGLKTMQVGDQEAAFRVPMDDLDRLLPILNAKRLVAMTDSRREALSKARRASPLACAHEETPDSAPGTTQ